MRYESFFAISSAAADRKLVTQTEVEDVLGTGAFAGVSGVDALILKVSDLIALECREPSANGATPPTLRQETIVETFRRSRRLSDGAWPYQDSERRGSSIFLARFPVGSIMSVAADTLALSATDYELRPANGQLVRLASGAESTWTSQKIVVTYVAGYAAVPEPLKMAAIRLLQEQLSASARDPLLKSESVEGVSRFDYWVSGPGTSASERPVSPIVAAMLEPFRYPLQ